MWRARVSLSGTPSEGAAHDADVPAARAVPGRILVGDRQLREPVRGCRAAGDWLPWERAGHAPPSGDGNGFATRYAEDFGLLSGIGLRHFRLSLEWGRVCRVQAWPRPPDLPRAAAWSQHRAAALDENGVAPAAVALGDPFPGAHDAEPGGPVKGGAGGILREDARLDGPDPGRLGGGGRAPRSVRPMPWPPQLGSAFADPGLRAHPARQPPATAVGQRMKFQLDRVAEPDRVAGCGPPQRPWSADGPIRRGPRGSASDKARHAELRCPSVGRPGRSAGARRPGDRGLRGFRIGSTSSSGSWAARAVRRGSSWRSTAPCPACLRPTRSRPWREGWCESIPRPGRRACLPSAARRSPQRAAAPGRGSDRRAEDAARTDRRADPARDRSDAPGQPRDGGRRCHVHSVRPRGVRRRNGAPISAGTTDPQRFATRAQFVAGPGGCPG